MTQRNIYDLLKLKAKCTVLEKKLYKTNLFVGEPRCEIHIDDTFFDEVVQKLGIKIVHYNANWHYQDRKYGEAYFYIILHKQLFKVFCLWKKGD